MTLYSIFLQTINSLLPPLNHYFTEPVIFHTSSTSGMANKMNHIPTLSSTGKCLKLHQPMLIIKIKLYSSKYFIQNNPDVKNNLHPLFLQESPVKDSLLLFKYLKLSYRDTEPNSWLPTFSHALLFSCKHALWFLFNQILDSDWLF